MNGRFCLLLVFFVLLSLFVSSQVVVSEGYGSVTVDVFPAVFSCPDFDYASVCDLVNFSNNGVLIDCSSFQNLSVSNCSLDVNSSFFLTVGNESYNFSSDVQRTEVANGTLSVYSDAFVANFSCPDVVNLSELFSCPELDYSKIACVSECPALSCAEIPACPSCSPTCSFDGTWIYVLLAVIIVGLAVMVFFVLRSGAYE